LAKAGHSQRIEIWSATLTQHHKKTQLSSNLNIVCQEKDRLFNVTRRSTEFSPFARNGQQRTPNASLGLDLARAIAHRTSQKAELFCEIRMMQPVVMIARNAMDAHYCWLLLESPTQLEGTLLERQSCQSPFF
jgi:hypothetical protein